MRRIEQAVLDVCTSHVCVSTYVCVLCTTLAGGHSSMQSPSWQLFCRVLFMVVALSLGLSGRSPQAMAASTHQQVSSVTTRSLLPTLPTDLETPDGTSNQGRSPHRNGWSSPKQIENSKGSVTQADFQPELEQPLTPTPSLINDSNAPNMPHVDHSNPDDATDHDVSENGEHRIEDPELGVLRLRELPVRTFNILDPELGVLRLQEVPIPAEERFPWLYWRTQLGFFWTDNVLSASEDPVREGIYQARMSLDAYPELNSRTFGVISLGGSLTRYADESNLDTQQFGAELGLYHTVTPRAYIQGGWRHEQFFARTDGDRFLRDNTLYFGLGRRDTLTSRLSLDTAYTFEYSTTDPIRRSRVFNRAYASFTYRLTPELDANVFYQLELTDFTRQDRNDFSQQLIGSLYYDFSSVSQLSVYAGGRLGDSSESFIDFDSLFVGVSISVNLPLF